jgi:glyoxylase-like metal-dependent hydrolase (beta-lactamase superfamily II)
MKQLHRADLFMWSAFDESRNIDFNSILWVRDDGNALIDPLPLSEHDRVHLDALGGVATIIITNSDHARDARQLADSYGAQIMGPAAERESFPLTCNVWLEDGDEPLPGMRALAMNGSKTAGELALLLDESTLITGDLVRCHQAGTLRLLPDPKLIDKASAVASIRRLAALDSIAAVVVGDGFSVFRDGQQHLQELVDAVT